MMDFLFKNTKSMIARLKLFFLLFSLVAGLICSVSVLWALHWADDTIIERQLIIEYQEAVKYFQEHNNAKSVRLNSLTTAYKTIDEVPQEYLAFLQEKNQNLEEVWVKPQEFIYGNTDLIQKKIIKFLAFF